MQLMFIPLYIRFIGIEAYGLVGIFVSLMAIFDIFGQGLTQTMTREMARLSTTDPNGSRSRVLARTLEALNWSVALILGMSVFALAGPIAQYWVKADGLSQRSVELALMISGGLVLMKWPAAFYAGGLRGMDLQPLLNAISCSCATLRGLITVAALWLVSPNIQTFFGCQIVASAVETFCLATALWSFLPGRGMKGTFSSGVLKSVWRFSAGITGIAVAYTFLTQMDKVVLSKMVSLEQFGYYTVAWMVSAQPVMIIGSIEMAVYPTITRLAGEGNEPALTELYHKSCQAQTVLLVPATLVLVLFGDVVLMVWTGNPDLVKGVGPVMSILSVGMCLNGFTRIPSLTQTAYGWTSLLFSQNVLSIIALVPLLVLLTRAYQEVGAASVWAILNASYVLIMIHFMHSRILKGAQWDWYIYDIGLPSLAALVTALTCRLVMPELHLILKAFYVTTAAGLSFLAATLAAPFPREKLFELVRIMLRRWKDSATIHRTH